MGTKFHKEGPTTVGGSLMGLRPVIKNLRYSEKSHKEGPTAGGRIPYERASGKKESIMPGSAQNLIRRESHKEGPRLREDAL